MGFRERMHEKSEAQGRYEVLVSVEEVGKRSRIQIQKAWMVVDC